MLDWVTEAEFLRRFDLEYRPFGISLTESLVSHVTPAELRGLIPTAPASPVTEDGLGPRVRWYGSLDGALFFVTHYLTARENYTVFSTRPMRREAERYQWSFLEKLTGLPPAMLSRIAWIRRDHSAATEQSIFFKDQHGIVWEVYRAESSAEAVELIGFLVGLGAKYKYWIGEPEDLNSTWILVKSRRHEADQIVGRFTSRGSTEEAARMMSLADEATYRVKEDKVDGAAGLAFRGGVGLGEAGAEDK